MRRKEVGEDLMKDNEQYRKVRQNKDEVSKSPRESPSRQGPDRQGYGRQEFDRWTMEELTAYARQLEIPQPDELPRGDLIEALVARQLT